MNTQAHQYWVIKVGSALVTAQGQGLNDALISQWTSQIATLAAGGVRCVVVSSGSIVAGIQRLGWSQRPTALHELQAAAAVGQSALVQTWEQGFSANALTSAQILLTHADLANRVRYLNARSTIRTLVNLNVVPVINENDTVVIDEIKFGDNDTLAALVANLIEASRLVILTDQTGLYTKDPRHHVDATLVTHGKSSDKSLESLAGSAGQLGRGGMLTKVQAAARAARSGTDTTIASGREPNVLPRLLAGEQIGTHLSAGAERLAARKQWLAGQLRDRGTLWLDAGATRVVTREGRSLLPVGVTRCEGTFERGDLVVCRSPEGAEVARGLVNYNHVEVERIKGNASSEFQTLLGYIDEAELIHRDNMVVV